MSFYCIYYYGRLRSHDGPCGPLVSTLGQGEVSLDLKVSTEKHYLFIPCQFSVSYPFRMYVFPCPCPCLELLLLNEAMLCRKVKPNRICNRLHQNAPWARVYSRPSQITPLGLDFALFDLILFTAFCFPLNVRFLL